MSHAGMSAYVNSYHHSNSLLFQFILSEFIHVYEQIQKLDFLCSRKSASTTSHVPLSLNSEEICEQISESLSNLVGSTREYMRLFSWNFSEGLLPKLRTYCALFLQNADSCEKELMGLQHYTEKVWQACLQAIDIHHDSPQDRTPFLTSIDKASSSMQRLAKLLARTIHQFKDDENVVFFILRYKDQFDKIYGSRFVIKLLCRMFPKGLNEVRHVLTKKYGDRGFDNVLPLIANKIAELEAASL